MQGLAHAWSGNGNWKGISPAKLIQTCHSQERNIIESNFSGLDDLHKKAANPVKGLAAKTAHKSSYKLLLYVPCNTG